MNQDDIINGARTAFINEEFSSSADFRPKLLYNNRNNKVINSIRDELKSCDEFIISSAFITYSGIVPILEEFKQLEKNDIKGKQENKQHHHRLCGMCTRNAHLRSCCLCKHKMFNTRLGYCRR